MTNANQPAFPEQEFSEEQLVGLNPGLTKREYFAIKILSGLVANANNTSYGLHVSRAVEAADLLIEQLNKPV